MKYRKLHLSSLSDDIHGTTRGHTSREAVTQESALSYARTSISALIAAEKRSLRGGDAATHVVSGTTISCSFTSQSLTHATASVISRQRCCTFSRNLSGLRYPSLSESMVKRLIDRASGLA